MKTICRKSHRLQWTAAIVAMGLLAGLNQGLRADITSGLENHYAFDDDGSIDLDSSGNGQDAMTVTGVTWVLDDVRDGVIEFDPADAGFVHAPMVDLNDTGGEFTIAAWVLRSSETHTAGNDGIFTVQQPGTTNAGHPKIIGAWNRWH